VENGGTKKSQCPTSSVAKGGGGGGGDGKKIAADKLNIMLPSHVQKKK